MCARAHWAQAALGKTNAICARWLMLTFIDGVACGRIREKTFISKGLWLFGGTIKPHKQQLYSDRLTVFSYSFYLREKAYFIHLLKINIWRCVAKKLYILSQNLNVIKLFEVFWSVFSPIFSECYFVCKKGTLHNLLAARTCANASLIFFLMCARAQWSWATLGKPTPSAHTAHAVKTWSSNVHRWGCVRADSRDFISRGTLVIWWGKEPRKQQVYSKRLAVFSGSFLFIVKERLISFIC